MTNIEKWPMAFENGIPKVGGRWQTPGYLGHATVGRTDGRKVIYEKPRGFDWAESFVDETGGFTFLGFADSVNQGAAAPQKPPEGWTPQDAMICLVCLSAAMAGCSACGCAACTQHLATAMAHGGHCPRRAKSAPIVAPPPSLKAAVQQEGLSIPPQGTVRHEVFEAAAQKWEGAKQFNLAGQNMKQARAALAADLAYDAEADAIREGRIVLKAALQEMGKGDRACFKARNLREFEAIKSAEHAMWNWWGKP